MFCALGMWETPRDATPAVFQGPKGDLPPAEALGGSFRGVGVDLGVEGVFLRGIFARGSLLADSSDPDVELPTIRHQPEGLEQLLARTKFTKTELQSLYRGFKNVSLGVRCPDPPNPWVPTVLRVTSATPLPRNVLVASWMRKPSHSSTHGSSLKAVSRECPNPAGGSPGDPSGKLLTPFLGESPSSFPCRRQLLCPLLVRRL